MYPVFNRNSFFLLDQYSKHYEICPSQISEYHFYRELFSNQPKPKDILFQSKTKKANKSLFRAREQKMFVT